MPTTLDSVLGTYRWFYYSYDFRDGVEPDSGYITLEKKSKAKATPAKVSGSIQLHVHNGTFQGLQKVEEKSVRGKNGMWVDTQKYRKNFWEIKEIEWEGSSGMDEVGTGFGVCEVQDDNGNPFLKYEWGDPEAYTCHGGNGSGFYVGKKVTPSDGDKRKDESDEDESDEDESDGDESDQGCELTDDEKIRLGMLLSEKEIKEWATKGYIKDSLKSLKSDDVKKEEIVLKRKLFTRLTDEEERISSNKKVRKV